MWNYFRADGKLHLLVEWEPDAEFFPVLDQEAEEIIDDVCKCRYENFTVGGVISKSNMKYGYAEIRSRATPVTVSSAFWVIGNHFDIDVFEDGGKSTKWPRWLGEHRATHHADHITQIGYWWHRGQRIWRRL